MAFTETELPAGFPDQDLEDSEIVTRRAFPDGSFLYSPEDPATSIFIVFTGTVKTNFQTRDAREILVSTIGPGTVLGWEALAHEPYYRGSAEALDDCDIAVVAFSALPELVKIKPDLAYYLLEQSSMRMRMLERRMEAASALFPDTGLAILLLDLTEKIADPKQIKVKQKHLASDLGVVRESVSRLLRKLHGRGTISVNGSPIMHGTEITILNSAELKKVATGETRITVH